jgi:nucleotide-binding universal stress UspA family protein
MEVNDRPRIVVGIDGSECSRKALRWAANEARLRKATLEVVGVWSFPTYVDPMGGAYPMPGMIDQTEDNERKMIDDEVASVLGEDRSVTVKKTLRCGSTANELLDVAAGADLLVVGSRGRGGFATLLLGSTAMTCAHNASVPVVVVREGDKHDGNKRASNKKTTSKQ